MVFVALNSIVMLSVTHVVDGSRVGVVEGGVDGVVVCEQSGQIEIAIGLHDLSFKRVDVLVLFVPPGLYVVVENAIALRVHVVVHVLAWMKQVATKLCL